jgi:AcrR family transcriptional regulator
MNSNIRVNVTNMKSTTGKNASTRTYRQGARAEASAETYRRIVLAFLERLNTSVFADITFDSIAADTGVTVQTVIRRFENKEGLLRAAAEELGAEIRARRRAPQGDIRSSIRALVADYEITGGLVIHLLAQDHHETVRGVLELGRKRHRDWVQDTFRKGLEPLSVAERARRVAGLVVLTDVYTWKLLRRDQGLSRAATAATILQLIEAWTRPADSNSKTSDRCEG